MTAELTALSYAALLQIAQLALTIVFGDAQTGIKYGASARDEPRPLIGLAGRLDRALNNHMAALVLFTIAVVVVTLAEKSTSLTVACAWTYVIARAAYVPAYAFGIAYVRSIIWTVAIGATLTMLVGVLL